jgi:predicted GIY-YIG superfamily endonuclease
MYVIYALVDPRDNLVHYVGLTEDVYQRFQAHINCTGSNVAKNAWITEMRQANVLVQMVELERAEDLGTARIREMYWIQHYQHLQHPIKNIIHNNHKFAGKVIVRSNIASRRAVKAVEASLSAKFDTLLSALQNKQEAKDAVALVEMQSVTGENESLNELVDATDATTEESFTRLDAIKEAQFRAAYKIRPNIDACLRSIQVGTGYRQHAREIVADMKMKGEVK